MRDGLRRSILVASLSAGLLSTANGCRCQRDAGDSKVVADLWSAPEPFKVPDGSLASEQYVALGLPVPDRNWGSQDMALAASQLKVLAGKIQGQLPRAESARSGAIFARMVSASNLTVFSEAAIPTSIRLPAAAEYLSALNAIRMVYVTAADQQQVSGNDLVELGGAWLRASLVVLTLMDEYLSTLPTGDPPDRTRRHAIEQMRAGVSGTLSETVNAIAEPRRYGLPARRKLVALLSENLPAILPRLPSASRETLLRQCNDLARHPQLSNLQTGLAQLSRALEPFGSGTDDSR